MVSRWMENGNILSFVTKYPAVNRLELVRPMHRRSGTKLTRANVDDRGHPWSRLSPQQRSRPWRSQERMQGLCSCFLQLTYRPAQPNVLIDEGGNPRLSDFGLRSITNNIDSVNASTPNHGCTVRYCAPELLDTDGTVRTKKKPTNKGDVYSLSMVIVEVRLPPERRPSGPLLTLFPAGDWKDALPRLHRSRCHRHDLKWQTSTNASSLRCPRDFQSSLEGRQEVLAR